MGLQTTRISMRTTRKLNEEFGRSNLQINRYRKNVIFMYMEETGNMTLDNNETTRKWEEYKYLGISKTIQMTKALTGIL